MSRQPRHSGFTLLELVLVLVILSTVLAMASPSLRGWGRGSKLRDATDSFLAMTRLARSEAVATARVHRLCVNADGYYELTAQEGEQFVAVDSSLGQPVLLPEDIRIEVVKQDKNDPTCIRFFPNGRTEAARVRITSLQAGYVEIEAPSPAEPFQVTNTGEAW